MGRGVLLPGEGAKAGSQRGVDAALARGYISSGFVRAVVPSAEAFRFPSPAFKETQMVLLEFSMAPVGQGESVSAHVARILDVIDKSGVPYQLTPMGTILEGDWDRVMAVVTACFKTLEADFPRIAVGLKVDYRVGPESRLRSKIARVEERLGRKLST